MVGKCGEKGAGTPAHAGVRPVLAWETGVGQGGSPGDGDPFRIPEGETNKEAVGPWGSLGMKRKKKGRGGGALRDTVSVSRSQPLYLDSHGS